MSRFSVPGIPDEEFIRDRVPMTKREIRVLSLSELQVNENSIIADVGAGTGSVSIELAFLAKTGQVYAFEKKPEAVQLIKKNCEHFGISNIEIIAGQASAQLSVISKPLDALFIGGSGGELDILLEKGRALLKENGRVVINAVNIETLNSALEFLKYFRYREIRFIQASISRSRKLGQGHALEPINPVFIIGAVK